MLVGARVAQGVGAAMMAPAGLSILTTSFTEGKDLYQGARRWGGDQRGRRRRRGCSSAGCSPKDSGGRWVLFVNIPVCVLIVVAAFRLVPG